MQEYEKENAKQSERFEARFQEYEALIAESLAKIGQQLREPDEAMQDMKLASSLTEGLLIRGKLKAIKTSYLS